MRIKRQFTLLNLTGLAAMLLVTSGVFWMWLLLAQTYSLQQTMSQIQLNLISTINQVFIEFRYEDSLDRSFEALIERTQQQLTELDGVSTEAEAYQASILSATDSVLALYRQLTLPETPIAAEIRMHLQDKLLFQLHALFDDSVIMTQLIVNDSYLRLRQFGLWAICALLLASMAPILTHRSISIKLNHTIRTIQSTLTKVKQGDFRTRNALSGSDELVQLANDIDDMISTLQELTVSKHELETMVQERTAALQKLSFTDNLTGIANRRSLMAHGTRELARALRTGRALSLVMIDLDLFKRVNDSLGHKRGDWALQAVCKTISEQLRGADLFARLGGEEFVVLLSDTELTGAIELAQRMRAAVERRFKYEQQSVLRLTISLGVAVLKHRDSSSLDELISQADRELYLAKKAGRNCVRPAPVELTESQTEG